MSIEFILHRKITERDYSLSLKQPDITYYLLRILCFILISTALFSCSKTPSVPGTASDKSELFTLMDSKTSGIDFVNEVIDGEKFNILTYRNFYNGGGVAIGDINNDSLPDIYFTANQKQNKLYLNKGNFVFEDITEKAGVGGSKPWSTGVTMADVNGDGLLDIYVCNSGDVDGADKENDLYINNGNLTFSEEAKKYNLNNLGYSTHAAFFDYDLDGDLDCYILNNSFKDPGRIELYKKVREEANDVGGDKLMRNDGNIFTDVTREAGIYSSDIGFGLGVAISDLNADHLPDIYISNDFWERDYLYINLGNGKFKEELIDRMNYCSVSSMGSDIADINNDGMPEIFSTDMLPADNKRLKTTIAFDPYHLEDLKYRGNFHYQMIQNCLHLNNGKGNFQEIALFSGVAATDWSWGALIFDFENDGIKDIFVSNGIYRDIMYMDFRDFLADAENQIANGKMDYPSLIAQIPSQPLSNYAFQQTGNLKFTDKASSLGLSKPSFSNGSAYGDLDNDGDQDLVVNNLNSPAFLYRNESDKKSDNHFLKVKFNGPAQNPFGIGAHVTVKTDDKTLVLENFNTRGFESSIEPLLLFGLGKSDTINEVTVVWPDKKIQVLKDIKINQYITLDYKNAVDSKLPAIKYPEPDFKEISKQVIRGEARHVENTINDFDQEILLPGMLSTEGPRLVMGDVNNDKREDFILLGASGDPDKLFIQQADGTFSFKVITAFKDDAYFESTCGAFIDYDGDNDMDLMIGSGGNETRWDKKSYMVRTYKNDGKGNYTPDPTRSPPVIGNFSTLEVSDYNGDGQMDVFLGARMVPGNYGLPPQSYLLKNDEGYWLDMAPPALSNAGMVTDASWSDIDSDGDPDLIVAGEWSDIKIFKNENGRLNNQTIIPNSQGWWTRVHAVDLDKDGNMDFVLGNWGLNSKFKASVSKPLTMFVNDFDNNGKSEFIINWYPPADTIAYPFAPKNELTSQLPALRKSILKYENYAPKTYDSLFPAAIRKTAIEYKANTLESAILWNDGKNFTLTPLPLEAQLSPVYGIIADDLDGDSFTDIWLGGNFYALKPQVGRHDASKGVFLKGGPGRSFKYESPDKSGIFVQGEVRDATLLRYKNTVRFLVARNNARALLFQRK